MGPWNGDSLGQPVQPNKARQPVPPKPVARPKPSHDEWATLGGVVGQGARSVFGILESQALQARDVSQMTSNPTWVLQQADESTDRIATLLHAALAPSTPAGPHGPTPVRQSPPPARQPQPPPPARTPPGDVWSAATPRFEPAQNYALADAHAFSNTIARAIGLNAPDAPIFGETTGDLQSRQPWVKDQPRNLPERLARLGAPFLLSALTGPEADVGVVQQLLARARNVALPAVGAAAGGEGVRALGGTPDQQVVGSALAGILGGGLAGVAGAGSPAHFSQPMGPPVITAPTGRHYSVDFEMGLDPADYGKGSKVHNNRAAAALHADLILNPDFSSSMQEMIPGLREAVSDIGGRRAPRGWIWHHDIGPGTMQLVPGDQHAPGSVFQDVLHPGGVGGYATWARPAGAPRR